MNGIRLLAAISLTAAALPAFSMATARAAGHGTSVQTRGQVTISGPAGIAFSPALVLGTRFRLDLRPTRKNDADIAAGASTLAQSAGCGALFTVAGDPGQQVSLAIPDAVRMRRDKDGNEVSLATQPDCAQPMPRPLATATIGQGGDLSFAVGGLDVLPTQQGAWRGMLHITAQYN